MRTMPVVFMIDDYVLFDNLNKLEALLTKRGIHVIRGPRTIPGEKLCYTKDQYSTLFENADVMIFNSRSVCDANVIQSAKHLRAIITTSMGMETVDQETATKRGIIVANNAILENYYSVAEAAICAMLMLSQQTMKSVLCVKEKGGWKPPISQSWSRMFYGQTVGFIGFGTIAKATAARLVPFGVKMIAYSPHLTKENAPDYVKPCSLEEVLQASDFVGLYVAINKSTYNMINKDTLSMMKRTAYLINISRGDAVNEMDLYEALQTGTIAGAALDTFKREPLEPESPLRTLSNVILTPHMAGSTYDNYESITRSVYDNVIRVLEGELPLHCRNPQIGTNWKEQFKNIL